MRSSFTSVVVLAAVAPVALAAPTAFQAVNGHMTGVEAPVHFQRDTQQVTGHSHDEVGHVHFQRDVLYKGVVGPMNLQRHVEIVTRDIPNVDMTGTSSAGSSSGGSSGWITAAGQTTNPYTHPRIQGIFRRGCTDAVDQRDVERNEGFIHSGDWCPPAPVPAGTANSAHEARAGEKLERGDHVGRDASWSMYGLLRDAMRG